MRTIQRTVGRMGAVAVVVLASLAGFGVMVAVGASAAVAQGTGSMPAASVPADSGVVEVRLADGSTLFGRVVSENETTIRLELLSGDIIDLRRDRIESIRVVEGRVVGGKVWHRDPNATRLFFGPTGRSLRSGDGYFSVYELVAPFVAVGATDWLTLAGGTPLIFGGGSERLFWLAPKVQVVRSDAFNVSLGALHFLTTGSAGGHVGIAYGVGTVGDADRALTIGAGIPYWDGEMGTADPIYMAGGEIRVSRGIKLISENYFFPGGGFGVLSAGPRFFGEKLTADLGLAMPVAQGSGFFVFPLVSFVYNW